MYTVKFHTMIFFEDVISETCPMSSENVPAFVEKLKKAGFDIIGVYPYSVDDEDDDEIEEIVVEEFDEDED